VKTFVDRERLEIGGERRKRDGANVAVSGWVHQVLRAQAAFQE
jgi:hypothetical protein